MRRDRMGGQAIRCTCKFPQVDTGGCLPPPVIEGKGWSGGSDRKVRAPFFWGGMSRPGHGAAPPRRRPLFKAVPSHS